MDTNISAQSEPNDTNTPSTPIGQELLPKESQSQFHLYHEKAKDCFALMNDSIETFFGYIGWVVARDPWLWLIGVFVSMALCSIGLFTSFKAETNIYDLWTPTDSPVWDENDFIDKYWSDFDYGLLVIGSTSKKGYDENILSSEYLEEWLKAHLEWLSTWPKKNYTGTNRNGEEVTLTFGYYAENYYDVLSLSSIANASNNDEYINNYASEVIPLCRLFATSPLEAQFELPCYMLTILDCFTEGGFSFPYETYLEKTYFTTLYSSNVYLTRPSFEGLSTLELGEIIAPSCKTWSGTTVPSNYIYGGETRVDSDNQTSDITSVNSFETIAYVDSAYNIARKTKIALGYCSYTSTYSISCPEPSDEEIAAADDFLNEWLADYIDFMNDYSDSQHDNDDKLLDIVFWTPRSASDLLESASAANIPLLVAAYIAMIAFALISALRPKDLFASRGEAACIGILICIITVVGSLGLGALWETFSPNIIQVLPFMGLGFGVDEMFVLLSTFKYKEKSNIRDMIKETTRIAGSSLALTSLAFFLALVICAFMVLPDVARFARFSLIMVFLNFWTILIGFAAVLALLAQRMKNGYIDFAWLFCFANFTKAKSIHSDKDEHRQEEKSILDPLYDFFTRTIVRIIMVILFFTLIAIAIYGSTLIRVGLPLADIVPDGSYAQKFLEVREKFYFSYVVNLWSDAHRADLKPIDWENKFETWINLTQDIYTMSDLVYDDENVHDFWAWKLQTYNIKQYSTYFVPYTLNTIDVTITTGKSYNCEDDRLTYCFALDVDYTYNSTLYTCLMFNYDELSNSGCQAYLSGLAPTNTTSIAKQIYVISSDSEQATGLYVAPSDDTTNVYYKYNTSIGADGTYSNYGVIFQTDDNTWIILDTSYNLLYISAATEGSYPPQYSWTDINGNYATVTIVYYDTDIKDQDVERGSDFIDFDISRTVYSFSYQYNITGESASASCYAFELFQKTLQQTTTYNDVIFTSTYQNSIIQCDTIIESSSVCASISKGNSLATTKCGTYEPTTNISSWWINTCGTGSYYTIVATPSDLSMDNNIACGCENETILNGTTESFSYLAACSANWGGFNVNATDKTCSDNEQNIGIKCTPLQTCTELTSCIEEIEEFPECNDQFIEQYFTETGVDNDIFLPCLVPNYDKLSSCCQEAVQNVYFDQNNYKCNRFKINDGAESGMCSACDYCDDNCDTICYDNINADCASFITGTCSTSYDSGNSSLLYSCLKLSSTTSCCNQSLSNYSYYEECVIPRDTYWNYTISMYDYSDCEDETSTVGCGSYNNTQDQLNCMLDQIDNVQKGCCQLALEFAQPSYIFTRDCQGDVVKYCGLDTAADADTTCLSVLISNPLSSNCEQSLNVCGEDGDWPATSSGSIATINCSLGYSGTQTRQCISSTIPYWNNTIVNDSCVSSSCPAYTDSYGLYWGETEVYHVRSFLPNVVPTPYSEVGCPSNYLYALCNANESGPYWEEPVYNCKTSFQDRSEEWRSYSQSGCNTKTASLISTRDVSDEDNDDDAKLTCQNVCMITLTSKHCQGFEYDKQEKTCYFYDYCDITANGTQYPNTTFYVAPLALPEFVAYYCVKSTAVSIRPDVYDIFTSNGIPNPLCFNMTVWEFFVDPSGGVLYQDKIIFNDKENLYDSISGIENIEIVTTANSFAVKGINDDEVAVEFIEKLRTRLNEWYDEQIYAIPGGLVISLYTQYVGVEEDLLVNLGYVSIVVILTGFIFLLDPVAVFVVLICDAAMIVEIYGFSDWTGLRINGVLVLNIVIAIGLVTEFTAHNNRAFILADDSNRAQVGLNSKATSGQIRLKKSLREMFVPVTLGAVTNFIGILPIAGTTFPYFRQYYFYLYVMIVVFGWVNGVIFQPIILSFLNPGTFVHERKNTSAMILQSQAQSQSQIQVQPQTQTQTQTQAQTQTQPIQTEMAPMEMAPIMTPSDAKVDVDNNNNNTSGQQEEIGHITTDGQ